MKEQPDLQILVRQWVTLANDDLESAKELNERGHWRQACFLSQQAVEKYIKALLIARQIPFERTHNIENLASLLSDAKSLGLLKPGVLDLSDYAVDTRYPGHEANHLDKSDADRAVEAAVRVSQSIHKALNL
jgi:HEPN domain-containing protein